MTTSPTPTAPENEKATESTADFALRIRDNNPGNPYLTCWTTAKLTAELVAHVATEVAAATARLEERVRELRFELDQATDAVATARVALGKHDKPFLDDAITELIRKLAAYGDVTPEDVNKARQFIDDLSIADIEARSARDTLTAQCVDLREALESIREYWNGNVESSVDAANVHQERADEALSRTASDFAGKVVVERGEWERVNTQLATFKQEWPTVNENLTALRARVSQLEGALKTVPTYCDALTLDMAGDLHAAFDHDMIGLRALVRKALAATKQEGAK